MKKLEDVLTDFDRAWSANVEQADKSIEDQQFIDVDGAQWVGSCGKQFKNRPKLEFDKISMEINRIIGENNANPISVKFIPDDDEAEQALADILQDRYRSDIRKSNGQEATDNAFSEATKGGFGAFRLSAQFENELDPDHNKQFVSFDPILSASSVVLWDEDAKQADKSDAKQCWVLHELSTNKFNTEYPNKAPWKSGSLVPGDYSFDWYGKDVTYIAEYYEKVEKKRQRLVFERPDGSRLKVFKDEMDDQIELEVSFYEQVAVEKVKTFIIEKALLSGDSVLEKAERIPGMFIPIIPQYGYRAYIKGKEYYMGQVRKQRDRQTFYNMAVSNLAEIMTESQREKDIFAPEQLPPNLMKMWADDNIENYPVKLANPLKNPDGSIIAAGPVGKTSAPQIPPALVGALGMINQDFTEELGSGQVTTPANTSGAAIQQVNERADMSYFILTHNARKAQKHAGRVYMSMAKELYGLNRNIRTVSEDGSQSSVEMQKQSFDQTGMPIIENDITRGSFEVIAESGPSFSSKKQAERDTLLGMMQATDSTNPMFPLLYSQMMQAMDGEGSATIRKVARYNELQMLLSISPSLVEPKNDEEMAYVQQLIQQMQQPPKPDPLMEIAMIEAESKNITAQSSMIKAQNDQANTQLSAIDTQSQAALREAQTVETFAKAQEISQKSSRESMRLVTDIRTSQQKSALELANALRG